MERVTEEDTNAGKKDGISVSPQESSSTVKSLAAALSMQFASGGAFGGSAVVSQNSSVTSTMVSTAEVRVHCNRSFSDYERIFYSMFSLFRK